MLRNLLVFVCLIAISPSLYCQNAVPVDGSQAARDPQALSIVQNAVTALGGQSLIAQFQSWQIQGQASLGAGATTFLWEKSGLEFRLSTMGQANSATVVTGHGSPAFIVNGSATKLPSHVTTTLFVPALVGSMLLNELQTTSYSIRFAGSATIDSTTVFVVRIAQTTDITTQRLSAQTWFFDKSSGLPVHLEFRLPILKNASVSLPGAMDLSDWRPIAGALYPFHIISWRQGAQAEVMEIDSLNVNVNIAASEFDAAGGVQ